MILGGLVVFAVVYRVFFYHAPIVNSEKVPINRERGESRQTIEDERGTANESL